MYLMTAFIYLFSGNLLSCILFTGILLGSILFICILHVHACISLLVIGNLPGCILFSNT